MIPTRVSHNPIIGPGVVPFGVDPAYDAQYKLNQAPRSHVASHGQGKPFTVEPAPPAHAVSHHALLFVMNDPSRRLATDLAVRSTRSSRSRRRSPSHLARNLKSDDELPSCFAHFRRYPYVTGTTVLGCKYKDGVMIACDTLCKSPRTSRASAPGAQPASAHQV